jgi:transporter family-2 protein
MQSLSMLFAFLVGAGLVIQVGLNMAVSRALGGAAMGALVNFVVGTLALITLLLFLRQPWPGREALSGVPAWAWFGGLFGAAYVALATFAGPRLGALLLLALTVAGQMVASVIVDHYGLLGFQQQPVTSLRMLGIAFLVVGVWLVAAR